MRFVPCIFLLLTMSVDLFSAENVRCNGLFYKNDASLIEKLRGYLYTIATSVEYSNNEIFKFGPIVNDNIFTRTTSDSKGPTCCKTMNVATIEKGDHFTYVIKNDKDCRIPLNENAKLKLISTYAVDHTYCLLVWTCRPSREGVHAFCSKSKVSEKMHKWISAQYKKYRLPERKVVHDNDHRDGKCFQKR